MWTTKTSATSKAKPEAIWKLWSDVANWKSWDRGIEASSLSGEFMEGTAGTLTPRGANLLPFKMTQVTPLESFTDETELPGAKLTFHHVLEKTSDGVNVTHQGTISGPAWENYASGLGKGLEAELPHTVATLVKLAEAQS
jgi:Polyketide cyclase / dehydrase and lipid transport